jgi:hypothetical protein
MKTKFGLIAFALLALVAGSVSAAESKEAAPPKKSAKQVEPSEEFRTFVASLQINSVQISFAGSDGNRALINRRVFREGDLVEKEHGVRLVEIDGDAKALTFQDNTGARIIKSYGEPK